jgi:tRNA G18 (ribose-2'-O)-methylase SpoU
LWCPFCQAVSMPLESPIDLPAHEVRGALHEVRNDFSVALMAPGNAFAVGAVIRVAHSYLAREILVVGAESFYPKGSMGMEKYETVVRLLDTKELFRATAGRPVWALERERARRSVHAVVDFPPGVVFVLGSERFGVPAEVLEKADEVLGIPLYGVNNSLPVTVAAGIVMSEWARRRYREGAVL